MMTKPVSGLKTILIFGGSFNPPHTGHAALLTAAAECLRPDRVLLVPAFHSPLKARPETSAAVRLRLLKAFVRGLPAEVRRLVGIDLSELRSGKKIYTWQTLRRVKALNPGSRLFLLLGSDCLAEFGRWKRPGLVARLSTLVAGRRLAYPLPGRHWPVVWLPGLFPKMSSSDLQSEMLLSGSVPGEIPRAVAAAIRACGCYGLELHRRLRVSLDKRRYGHSLAVGKLAAQLAARHGADVRSAAVAGLLHDCAKRLPPGRRAAFARRRMPGPDFSQISAHAPCLLHAAAGAEAAASVFGVSDPGVLSAIGRHALGAAEMSLLDKIVFIADIASEDRHFPGTAALRRLAFRDLDAALAEGAKVKMSHLLRTGRWIAPQGLELWNALSGKNRR